MMFHELLLFDLWSQISEMPPANPFHLFFSCRLLIFYISSPCRSIIISIPSSCHFMLATHVCRGYSDANSFLSCPTFKFSSRFQITLTMPLYRFYQLLRVCRNFCTPANHHYIIKSENSKIPFTKSVENSSSTIHHQQIIQFLKNLRATPSVEVSWQVKLMKQLQLKGLKLGDLTFAVPQRINTLFGFVLYRQIIGIKTIYYSLKSPIINFFGNTTSSVIKFIWKLLSIPSHHSQIQRRKHAANSSQVLNPKINSVPVEFTKNSNSPTPQLVQPPWL